MTSCTVLCQQCGVTTYPHSRCRCQQCGIVHRHGYGCRRVRFCPQCCLTTQIHSICDCCHCGHRHQVSQACRDRAAGVLFRAAMRNADPEQLNIGNMDQTCPFCGARTWPDEKLNCCDSGAIVMQPHPEVPLELSTIILSPHVLQNIRAYNNAFCMASVGHKSSG